LDQLAHEKTSGSNRLISPTRAVFAMRQILAFGLALLFLGSDAVLSASSAEVFGSGGVGVTIERFGARAAGKRPAVILLHGSDGAGDRYRAAAQRVAAGGYDVFLVHYLDRTGQSRTSYSTIHQNLPVWTQTVRDAIGYVTQQQGVDPSRIGLLGVSLGGGLALATAQQDSRVRAVVSYFGFVPQGFGFGRLAPTLVLHGAADRIVPVSNAYTLQNLLQARGVPHEVQIYPGQGHGFTGAAEADASQRITAFFRRYIGSRTASIGSSVVQASLGKLTRSTLQPGSEAALIRAAGAR
jgi:carboxymethylenebutenolidase